MSDHVIVMGVSGCGKSTLAQALAEAWVTPYIEGDDLHGADNVAKMAAGRPLTDTDRWTWLDRIGSAMTATPDGNRGAIASCSALRRAYRARLRKAVGPDLRFVMIELPRAELETRMRNRAGHYMPPALLDSQLATLEHPYGEGDVLVVDGTLPVDVIIDAIAAWRLTLLKLSRSCSDFSADGDIQ